MLLQFTVKNVLSFKEETTIDMTAVPAYKEHMYNLIQGESKEKYLRVAAIYGANASGKSNLFLGMRMFRDVVVKSMNSKEDGEKSTIENNYTPYAFENGYDNSEFQIIAVNKDAEYTYGFEYNDKEIVSEWLYIRRFSTKKKSMLIERDHQDITMGSSVRRECEKYKNQIPRECLALSFFSALSLHTDVFKELFIEIRNMIIADTNLYEGRNTIELLLPKFIDEEKNTLLSFLSAIDTGIKDITYEEGDKKIEFFTSHIGKDGKRYKLNLYNESRGTLKCIMILIFAYSVIARDGLMVVDELNAKLHPLLLKFVVGLFNDCESKAQLVYTTHDTTLLDKRFLRRDQVWFIEKDEFGYSRLSSLADFKIRSDASFEKDYLSGVYGGIPILRDYSIIIGE